MISQQMGRVLRQAPQVLEVDTTPTRLLTLDQLGSDSVADSTEGVKPVLGGTPAQVPPPAKTPSRRGTTNKNARGGSDTRRRRREWLVATYRADVDVVVFDLPYGPVLAPAVTDSEGSVPACRCYRCGELLTADTVSVDRIKPGCQGGTYARANIRPACGRCNSVTGATTRRK